jgi:hypothetical protein
VVAAATPVTTHLKERRSPPGRDDNISEQAQRTDGATVRFPPTIATASVQNADQRWSLVRHLEVSEGHHKDAVSVSILLATYRRRNREAPNYLLYQLEIIEEAPSAEAEGYFSGGAVPALHGCCRQAATFVSRYISCHAARRRLQTR